MHKNYNVGFVSYNRVNGRAMKNINNLKYKTHNCTLNIYTWQQQIKKSFINHT